MRALEHCFTIVFQSTAHDEHLGLHAHHALRTRALVDRHGQLDSLTGECAERSMNRAMQGGHFDRGSRVGRAACCFLTSVVSASAEDSSKATLDDGLSLDGQSQHLTIATILGCLCTAHIHHECIYLHSHRCDSAEPCALGSASARFRNIEFLI